MNQESSSDQVIAYRGHEFLIVARKDGDLWRGHFRLSAAADKVATDAPIGARHQCQPLDPIWATRDEAEMNATEAAHAAIDALFV